MEELGGQTKSCELLKESLDGKWLIVSVGQTSCQELLSVREDK